MTSNGPIPPISQLQDHDFHGTVEKVRKSRAQPRPTMWLSRSLGSVCINMCVFHAYLQLPTRLLLTSDFAWCPDGIQEYNRQICCFGQ